MVDAFSVWKQWFEEEPLSDYYAIRLLSIESPWFQRNDYLFYALSMKDYLKILSNISACYKKVRGQEGAVEDLYLYMRNLRGSAAYW